MSDCQVRDLLETWQGSWNLGIECILLPNYDLDIAYLLNKPAPHQQTEPFSSVDLHEEQDAELFSHSA